MTPAVDAPAPVEAPAPAHGDGTKAADVVAPPIVDRPIPFDDDRVALTLAYRRAHEDPSASTIDIVPKVVILHWTGGSTLESAWQTFAPARLAGRPELADASPLNVSAQFLVDRDGTIVRLMPETRMARHCIGLNGDAIGVENVGDGGKWPLTDAQADADAALVRWLAATYPIEVVIGHSEYRSLEGTPWFTERDPTYRTAKDDPGADFLLKVRERISDLHLRGATGYPAGPDPEAP